MHSNNPASIIFMIPNHACAADSSVLIWSKEKPFAVAISRGLLSDMCAFVWLHPAPCFHMTAGCGTWLRCQILSVFKSNVIFEIFPLDNRHPYTLCFSIQLHYSWQPPTCKMDTLLITQGFSEFLLLYNFTIYNNSKHSNSEQRCQYTYFDTFSHM